MEHSVIFNLMQLGAPKVAWLDKTPVGTGALLSCENHPEVFIGTVWALTLKPI